ncbi:hypothetical protein MYBA111488_03960 [Mycobacterium basiliense]
MSLDGLRGRSRPDGHRHRHRQRREPNDRECDDGVADQQRPGTQPWPCRRARFVVIIAILVIIVRVAVIVVQTIGGKQLVIGGLGVRQLPVLVPIAIHHRRGRQVSGGVCGHSRLSHRRTRGDGRHRRPASQREGGVFGNLHAHRRCATQLVGNHGGLLVGGTHQQHLIGGAGLVVEPCHQSVEGRCGVAFNRRRGQQRGRCVPRARNRQAGRFLADQQNRRVRAPHPKQRGGGLRLGQHRNVLHPGTVQRIPQFIGFALIRPAQPGGNQPVTLVDQQTVRADHGLRQHQNRVVGQIDRGLVNHGTSLGGRADERQARDRTRDRHPQHNVHLAVLLRLATPHNQQCPASLHCNSVGSIHQFGRQGFPMSAA